MSHEFVHLHLHSHYSILDGVCQIDPLLERAAELGMKELALTDHGAMFGVIEFYSKAMKKGIKPIVGMEAYVAPGSRKDKNTHGIRGASYHLTLLAKNYTGYQNLSRLSTLAYTEGFYYNPRVDKEILAEYSEGLIALSGCLSGEVSRKLLNQQPEEAEKAALEYYEIFGKDHFYLEIMNNGIADQQAILEPMGSLSRKLDIPLVATSDVHYVLPEHARVQDVLLCINTGKKLDDEKRMKIETDDFFLKSAEQMRLAFKGYEDACERTVEIARRCNLELNMKGFHLPTLTPPDGLTSEQYIDKLCQKGLRERYGDPLPEAVTERYRKEMDVILEMGFPDYFLIVWDLVKFARESNIPVGPGRGSAAGSIVSYALKITNIEPLRYGLLFERFLNEGRNEMPDIDLDFDKEYRQEVVNHIIKRHGEDHCAKIVTFGCLQAKSAVRDVGRVMNVPLHEVDTIAKMIPDMIKAKGDKSGVEIAMEMNPDLKNIYNNDPVVKEMLTIAGELDGVIRQTGIHAAGVVVADKPITEYGPLACRGEDVTTQFEMKILEKMGLCKIDVLGLETLTLLRKAIDNIRLNAGVDIDIDTLPLDDKPTYQMLCKGDAKGVFQFESDGFRSLLVKLRPDRFEDLIAAVAMYRPGPLGAGLVDTYINCKHGRETPDYLHPMMESLLEETHGLILYQEQVQALALSLAHFTLSQGDSMRRAMGKKDRGLMDDFRSRFISQSADTCGEAIAEKVFEQIEYFAGYGFNKSHSACYALIAYQTAYLKCHYPKEYMAALLTTNRGDSKKVVEYIDDARRFGIEILPPDINESGAFFTVRGDDIRFGLSAVKGVGDKAVEGLEQERGENGSYRNLYDFCERIDLRLLNRGAVEALIKAGAFDSLGGHRAQYVAGLEAAIASGSSAQKDRNSGQGSLFGGMAEQPEPALPDIPAWTDQEQLVNEKSVLGFWVSSHPLVRHARKLSVFGTAKTVELSKMDDRDTVTVGGVITGVKLRIDKNGKRFAQVTLEDMDGVVNVMVFSKVFEKEGIKELLCEDRIVFVCGRVDRSRDEPSIITDDIVPVESAEEVLTRKALLTLDAPGLEDKLLEELEDLLKAHRGDVPLYFQVNTHNRCLVTIVAGHEFNIKPSARLMNEVAGVLGEGRLVFGGTDLGNTHNNRN